MNAPSTFMFNFNTAEYYIAENDAGSLNVYSLSGELAFEMGSLFAVDSAGSYTENLKYTIEEVSENNTIISVSIDLGYLTEPERVFPVLIDPSIMVTGDGCTYDTFVSSRYPNSNYYLYDYLRTGKDDDYYIRRSYIRFDLPYYIDGDNVTSAYINIKKYSGATPSIKAYRVSGNWSSSTLTWSNSPSYVSVTASSVATYYSNDWYRLYVTNIVESWLSLTTYNYGFLIKDDTENLTSQWTTFYSSDAASPNKPELIINYYSVRPHLDFNYYLFTNYDMSSPTSELYAYLDTANDVFENTFNVSFNRYGTASATALNQRPNCNRTVSQICGYSYGCGECSDNSDCKEMHHKAGYYFCDQCHSDLIKVFRYVDFALCRIKNNQHGEINGTSDNIDIIVTLVADSPQRTTCHELSHWIGADDNVCVSGQPCVMSYGSPVYGVWCTQCAHDINTYLDGM